MKKHLITNITFYLIILLFAQGCANLNDDHINLGSGYTFITDSKYRKIIPDNGYTNTAIYSTVTDYNFNNRYIIAKQNPDYEHHKMFIEEDLESRYSIYCSYLKDSISKEFDGIREEVKANSNLYKLLKYKHVTDQNSIQDQQIIETVLDSVFHHDPYYIRLLTAKENYWIIDKALNKRIGPLSKSEFVSRCNELRIDIKLKK